MNTDSFYLGEDCYVYVNTRTFPDARRFLEDDSGISGIITYAYIGENFTNPLKISGIKFSADGEDFSKSPNKVDTVHSAKSKLADLILQHKELLIEYVKSQL